MKILLYNKLNKNKFSFITLFFISCLYLYQSNNWFQWTEKTKNEHFNILTDGSGYYAYLPATFIYQDFRFDFLKKISNDYNSVLLVNGTNQQANKNELVNKYYIGSAILMAPFFLANHTFNLIFNDVADGYSKSYRLSVSIAALFYFALGIISLIYLLNLFKINDLVISICIIAISLGTNLHFYTVYYPSFSHVYSFFTITLFLLLAKKIAENPSKKTTYLLVVTLAFIILLRPTNILILILFPFLFSNWINFKSTFFNFLKSNQKIYIISFFIFASIISIQLINIYLQTGKLIVDSYQNEKFEFLLNPKFFEVLFSYKKGLFIYSPVLLILFPALICLLKYKKYLFLGWVITFTIILYITSSWWCWWYGGGLGMRPFVDFSSYLILPIAIFINQIQLILKIIFSMLILFFIFIYRTYQIQFNNDILHYENMTDKTFWTCFQKTDFRYSWFVFFQDDLKPNKKPIDTKKYYYNSIKNNWSNRQTYSKLNYGNKNMDLDIQFKHISFKKFSLFFDISGKFIIHKSESNPGFIFDYYDKGKLISNRNFHIGSRIPKINKLTPVKFTIKSNVSEKDYDSLLIYFTRNVKPVAVKNLKLKIIKY